MSRKDFILIAETLRTMPSFSTKECSDVVRFDAMVSRMADALATTNSKFDRTRFVAACGGK